MSKLSDYYNFELQASSYLNSAHGDKSPRLKYNNDYICGEWYLKYVNKGNTIARIPKSSYLDYGHRFLNNILKHDNEFIDHIFNEFLKIITLSEKLEKMNYEDIKNDKVRDKKEFYDEYISIFPVVIGFGSPLDMALEEYATEKKIDPSTIIIPGESFITKEERDLQQIALQEDEKEKEKLLQEHGYRYSYVLNNYSGYHPANINYFKNRFEEIKKKSFPSKIESVKKPQTIEDWIGFLIYIRDERKKSNMIANGMLDRYLRQECERLSLDYYQAILLTPEEFEKYKHSKLPDYQGVRIVHATHDGFVDIDDAEWERLVDETEAASDTIKGVTASKGKATGKVKIILSPDEFSKMKLGEIIVTSMTRPEFAPIIKLASAIVTNEGGITCHAAIISRELGIPCIIATGNATQVLKDGDLVEVDADQGIVSML